MKPDAGRSPRPKSDFRKSAHVKAVMQKHLSKKRRPDDIDMAAARRKKRLEREADRSAEAASKPRRLPPMIQIIRPQTRVPHLLRDCQRPSVLLELDQPNFLLQFRRLFEEHVEGFVGLRGTKKPVDKNAPKPEWRVRLESKQQQRGKVSEEVEEEQPKKKSKKNASGDGRPDLAAERAEAIAKYRALMAAKKGSKPL